MNKQKSYTNTIQMTQYYISLFLALNTKFILYIIVHGTVKYDEIEQSSSKVLVFGQRCVTSRFPTV